MQRLALTLAALCAALTAACSSGRTTAQRDDSRRTRQPVDNPAPPPPGTPVARIAGAPEVSRDRLVTLSVGGDGITAYRLRTGAAASLACADGGADWTPEAPVATPARVDLAGLADGPVAACVVGRDAQGVWQKPAHATRVEWTLDTTPPAAFALQPLAGPDGAGAFAATWSAAADATPVTYEVTVAPADGGSGCTAPARRFQTTATTQALGGAGESLPGGRFVVCVTARDAAGNTTSATGSGQTALEVPVSLRLAWLQGEAADSRKLAHAALRPDGDLAAAPAAVAIDRNGRFEGRAALHVGPTGAAEIAYQGVVDVLAAEPVRFVAAVDAGAARPPVRLASGTVTESLGQQLALAHDGRGDLHALHAGREGEEQKLYHSTLAAGGEPRAARTEAIETATGASYQDASLAFDARGGGHAAFVRGGALFVTKLKDGRWLAPTKVTTSDCTAVVFAVLAVGPDAAARIAYLCTEANGDARSCRARLAKEEGGGFAHADLGVADTARACSPFNSSRPALAVDSRGRAHAAWRYTAEGRSGQWDVAYARDGEAPQMLGDWSTGTGFAQLALDGSGRAYVAYVAGGALRLAGGAAGWTPRTITIDGARAGLAGTVLELAGLSGGL